MNDQNPSNTSPDQVPQAQTVDSNSTANPTPTPDPMVTPPAETPNTSAPEPSSEAPITIPQPVSPAEVESATTPSTSGALVAVSAIFFGVLNWVIIPILIVFILHNFVFQAFHVVGSSMVPTLHDTDYIIVSKIGKSVSGFKHATYIPNRYDVVVFHYPKDPSLIFVKRVIGLPGEHVVVKNGQVTIFNSANPAGLNPNTTTYQRAADTTQGEVDDIVPQGSIFVLGDNRTPNGSFDSRDWGFLPSSYIVGTASIRLLPLDQFRLFSLIPQEIPALIHALL